MIVSRSDEILRTFDPIIKDTLLELSKKESTCVLTRGHVHSLSHDSNGSIEVQFTSKETNDTTKKFDVLLWAIDNFLYSNILFKSISKDTLLELSKKKSTCI